MSQRSIATSVIRGGTSNGVYFERDDLPGDETARDDLLPRLFGSPTRWNSTASADPTP